MQILDENTGELVDAGRLAWIPNKRTNGFKDGWTAMSKHAIAASFEMRKSGELKPRDTDVLLYLSTVALDYENWIRVSGVEIAEAIGSDRYEVSRSVSRLKRSGFLLEGPKVGRSKTYRLNPHVGWKGSSKNHKKALDNGVGLSIIQGGKDSNNIDWVNDL